MNTAVNIFHVGNCIVNLYDDRKVIVKQDLSEHHIEKKAYQLLKMLSVAPGELVDRNLLMNTIWERNGFFVSRSMDVYVTKLRNIFKVGTNIQIKCVRKQGLKLIITDESN